MKTDISLQVNKPADDVWDYFLDLDKVPEWSSAVLQARPDGAGAPRVGGGAFQNDFATARQRIETAN